MGMSNDKLIDLGWPFGGLCKMNLVIWVHVSGDEHPCRRKLALQNPSARARAGRIYEKHPLFLFLEGVPWQHGCSTLTAGAEEVALSEKLHSSSEELGCVSSAGSSAPSGGAKGLLTAPLCAGELDAHA